MKCHKREIGRPIFTIENKGGMLPGKNELGNSIYEFLNSG